ncbi:MAG: adenylate/guanylate cyclase domain-containing protein [Bacteroidota bacterium]
MIKKGYFRHLLFVLLALCLSLCPIEFYGQGKTVEELESSLKSSFGLDKLIVLNELSSAYMIHGDRKSLKYAKQAVNLGENIFDLDMLGSDADEKHLLRAYVQLGQIHFQQDNFIRSKENFEKASVLEQGLNNNAYSADISFHLSEINTLIEEGEVKESIFSTKIKDLKIGDKVKGVGNDIKIQAEITLAKNAEKKKNFSQAIDHYENAINLLRDAGNDQRINELRLNISFLLDSLGEFEKAQEMLGNALEEMELTASLNDEFYSADEDLSQSNFGQALMDPAVSDSLKSEQENLKNLSEQFAKEKNFEKSLEYFKAYQILSRKLIEDSIFSANKRQMQEQELVMLRQQKQIADFNVDSLQKEKRQQVRLRNTIIGISIVILVSALISLFSYFSKKKEHQKLTLAYRDLDETKGKLEDAEQKIVTLLKQQLSGDIAQELLSSDAQKPGGKHFVCVMFLDIRGFSKTVEHLSPEEIIAFQNKVFGFIIDIVLKFHGTINQLLGDGFMATFGAPVSHGNDVNNAYLAAKEILAELAQRNASGEIQETRVGIGLHAGDVVTGNVGNDARKQYSVTGNPVIIAARVEQLNKTYSSQLIITEKVYIELEDKSDIEPDFSEVQVKGQSKPIKILMIA